MCACTPRGRSVTERTFCMKLVTFAVPCQNAEQELPRLADCLLAAGEAAEIILIDDGSADGTGAVADGYAEEHPEIVRVIHQEAGGIGECISRAVRYASGRYLKIVDPRETVDAESLVNVMKKVRRIEAAGGVDMIVTNYTVRGLEAMADHTVRFRNVFAPGRIIGWEKTGRFRVEQRLTLQSCMFRTKMIRKSGITVPAGVSCAEDLFVFAMLPQVRELCYLDRDLCSRRIGAGVAVPVFDGDTWREPWKDRLTVCMEIFRSYCEESASKARPVPEQYMKRETLFQFLLTEVTVRLTAGEQTDAVLQDMWKQAKRLDVRRALQMQLAVRLRSRSLPADLK